MRILKSISVAASAMLQILFTQVCFAVEGLPTKFASFLTVCVPCRFTRPSRCSFSAFRTSMASLNGPTTSQLSAYSPCASRALSQLLSDCGQVAQ